MRISRMLITSTVVGKHSVEFNWNVNKHLSLSGTVINFLNQTGAKGSISGAELVDKENAAAYNGAWMAGSYIRPFTVEFSASLKF